MRTLGALLAALLLAGCSEAIFGHCGPQDTFEWNDARLYAALEDDGAPLAPGIGSAEALGYNGSVIETVQWVVPVPFRDEREWVRAMLDATTVSVEAANDTQARETLGAFLANLSAADEATQRAMVDAALANKSEAMLTMRDDAPVVLTWAYRTSPRGAWRVEELAAELGPQVTRAFATAGTARVEAGAYAFVLRVDVRSVDLDGIALTVDAMGNAVAHTGDRGEGASPDASADRLIAGLRARGLPEPAARPEARTVIC